MKILKFFKVIGIVQLFTLYYCFLQTFVTGFPATTNYSDNQSNTNGDTECLEYNEKKQCKRCNYIIMEDTRECVRDCSTHMNFIETDDFLGWVCFTSDVSQAKLSTRQVTLIAGAVVSGFILLLLVTAFLCSYRKRTRKPAKPPVLNQHDTLSSEVNDNHGFENVISETITDSDLEKRLAALREKEYFLTQLLREAKENEPSTTTPNSPRSTSQGLSQMLVILQDKEDSIKAGPRREVICKLVIWTENLFKLRQTLLE
ncbi:uncharacterized protein LOC111086122 [Limulus polyphemus]|uniref:Uncharacterized protein LOC111086122 n=1 Tax=Limulus polyphemus TaxID=6850 RepID=A0ABM1SII0_LIMPO|nr:uncharacterized protein LOC111086122 [Limulus polyphemus]